MIGMIPFNEICREDKHYLTVQMKAVQKIIVENRKEIIYGKNFKI